MLSINEKGLGGVVIRSNIQSKSDHIVGDGRHIGNRGEAIWENEKGQSTE